ncbi:MAG: hypothetical protein ACRCYT_09535 [Cetobacterium sp.]
MQINILDLETFKNLPKQTRTEQLKIYNLQQNYINEVYGEGSSTVYDDAKKIHEGLK